MHRIRVRFSEVDRQNVVFFANHLNYFDVALTELCRECGVAALLPPGHEFHVVHASTDYARPLRYDEEIEVGLRTECVGGASITFRAAIFGAGEQEASSSGMIVWVLADQATGRSGRIPDALRMALAPEPDDSVALHTTTGTRIGA